MRFAMGMLLGVGLLSPSLTHAQTVEALEAQLLQTEAQLSRLQEQLAEKKKHIGQAQQNAESATKLLVQAQQYPASLWQARAVIAADKTPSLLAYVARTQATELADWRTRYATQAKLYAEAQAQQQQWQDLKGQLAGREGRRSKAQRAQLAAAGIDATHLAQTLAAALNEPAPSTTTPVPDFDLTLPTPNPKPQTQSVTTAPRGRPLEGTVLVGFRKGEGAEAEGVVLGAKGGTPVVAPIAGQVLFAGLFRQLGGVVILQAPDGHDEVLGGLGVLMVQEGQRIKQGQMLGHIGMRGRLYWEVRVRGAARNPLALR